MIIESNRVIIPRRRIRMDSVPASSCLNFLVRLTRELLIRVNKNDDLTLHFFLDTYTYILFLRFSRVMICVWIGALVFHREQSIWEELVVSVLAKVPCESYYRDDKLCVLCGQATKVYHKSRYNVDSEVPSCVMMSYAGEGIFQPTLKIQSLLVQAEGYYDLARFNFGSNATYLYILSFCRKTGKGEEETRKAIFDTK
jgi:hypothetical protein